MYDEKSTGIKHQKTLVRNILGDITFDVMYRPQAVNGGNSTSQPQHFGAANLGDDKGDDDDDDSQVMIKKLAILNIKKLYVVNQV